MRLLWVVPVLLLLAGCGDKADIPTIEGEIVNGLRDQTDLVGVTVDCPDEIDWQAGGDFHCWAEARHSQSFRVTVSMENDAGEWSWQVG